MAGRPPLENGTHGTIKRTELAPNVWRARCRHRDPDGVIRSVQRDTPAGLCDSDGAAAEQALTDALAALFDVDGRGGRVTLQTELGTLAEMYLAQPDREALAVRTRDTYGRVVRLLMPRFGRMRVAEVTPRRLRRILAELAADHGQATAKHAKTILSGMFTIAVREGALPRNPVREIEPIRMDERASGRTLTEAELADLLDGLQNSTAPLPPRHKGATRVGIARTVSGWARFVDMVDPALMLAGTGLRRSELLGLLWSDHDRDGRTITVTGCLIRGSGSGLIREDVPGGAPAARTITVPDFVVEMLDRRRAESRPVQPGIEDVIFPSSVGTYRDPDNFAAQWRRVRDALGYDWVDTRTIRKSVAMRERV